MKTSKKIVQGRLSQMISDDGAFKKIIAIGNYLFLVQQYQIKEKMLSRTRNVNDIFSCGLNTHLNLEAEDKKTCSVHTIHRYSVL